MFSILNHKLAEIGYYINLDGSLDRKVIAGQIFGEKEELDEFENRFNRLMLHFTRYNNSSLASANNLRRYCVLCFQSNASGSLLYFRASI
jgi:hypothetical protein